MLPARAWGVEELTPSQRMARILEAGADQFGGEECTDLLLDLVREGIVSEERITDSARRLLRVKFRLGLFDDPYVDEAAAPSRVGTEEDRRHGHEAQARSVVVLHDDGGLLPLRTAGSGDGGRLRCYAEGLPEEVVAALGEQVADPAEADLALLRIGAPFQPRDDLFLEAWFHQGDLAFPPGLAHRLARIRAACPLVLDVDLDRAAVLTDIAPVCDALTGTFGVSGAAWVDALCKVLSANVDYACRYIAEHFAGVKVSRPQGTYMLFLDCTDWCAAHGKTIDWVEQAGWDVGVAWQDGRMFHGPCAIRMNLALPLSRVQEAFERLDRHVFNA